MEAELQVAREAYTILINASSKVERESFEEKYIYNISVVYDDRPFFFEYFKYTSNESGNSGWWSKGGLADGITALRGTAVYYTIHVLLLFSSTVMILTVLIPLLTFNRRG